MKFPRLLGLGLTGVCAALGAVLITACDSDHDHDHGPKHNVVTPKFMLNMRSFVWKPADDSPESEQDVLVAMWSDGSCSPDNTKQRYSCSLGFPVSGQSHPVLMSLYNLAVQGRRFGAKVITKPNDGILIKRQDPKDHTKLIELQPTTNSDGELEWKIPATGTRKWFSFGGPNPPKAENVYFVTFTGRSAKFKVEAHRVIHAEKPHADALLDVDEQGMRDLLSSKEKFFAAAAKSGGGKLAPFYGHDTTPPPPEGGGQDGDESER